MTHAYSESYLNDAKDEQRVNDIDKAQAQAVFKLSRAIGCTMEDLLENPIE